MLQFVSQTLPPCFGFSIEHEKVRSEIYGIDALHDSGQQGGDILVGGRNGSSRIEDYDITRAIGKGKFAVVYR